MPLTAVRRRLRARALDFLPIPVTLLGATGVAGALESPAALVVAALVLHQPQLGHDLRNRSTPSLLTRQGVRLALLGAMLFTLPAFPTATGWLAATPIPSTRLWPVMGVALGLYGLLFLTVRALRQHGHFATRLAVVGSPTDMANIAARLRENQQHLFHILGTFDESRPEEVRSLLNLGQREWLDAVIVARSSAKENCSPELLHQLRHLSAPIALATPDSIEEQWLLVDDLDLPTFAQLAANFGQDRYGFAVTPNADHLVRLQEDLAFRKSYGSADFVLFDSRFLARWLYWTHRQRLRVCPGSDLTATLFNDVIACDDCLVMVGGSVEQARQLRQRYGLRNLQQFIPPMGFINDPVATRECLEFIEMQSPFRFCLLAIGAPQQERIAALLKERGTARGLALCIGASLNFLTGGERRAPLWMQRLGMEWLYRLLQDPRRLAVRYLWRGPRVFRVLARHSITPRKRLFTVSAAAPDGRTHRSDTALPAIQRRTG